MDYELLLFYAAYVAVIPGRPVLGHSRGWRVRQWVEETATSQPHLPAHQRAAPLQRQVFRITLTLVLAAAAFSYARYPARFVYLALLGRGAVCASLFSATCGCWPWAVLATYTATILLVYGMTLSGTAR